MAKVEHLEEQIAHLTRSVDDLSDMVAKQGAELALATRRIDMLMQREAQREVDTGGTVPLGDDRPPHY